MRFFALHNVSVKINFDDLYFSLALIEPFPENTILFSSFIYISNVFSSKITGLFSKIEIISYTSWAVAGSSTTMFIAQNFVFDI